MNVLGLDINWPFWTRNKNGDNFYDLTTFDKWSTISSNLGIAQNHPILTPALLFVSKLFSQAQLKVERVSTGRVVENHDLMKLFRRPNFYQTLPDLLESLAFTQIANGVGVIYTKRIFGTDKISALYVLNYTLIKWPDSIKKGYFKNGSANDAMLKTKVIYDEGGENLEIELRNLLFFYDLPNAVSKNPFQAASRLDGLKQTLLNTNDSLIAKNIILKTNGKEMLSGSKDGFPLDPEEKAQAEQLFNADYGLSPTRKRGLITKANVTWKSLHIALRDLGLDESVKVDGNIIYTALHIPKDILSLEAKKTTYNNFKESMVSYIQNEMQSTLDSFVAVFNTVLDENFRLVGSYEHLPIMQFILLERYDGVIKQAQALQALRNAGIPDDIALDKCGFEPGTPLAPLQQQQSGNNETDGNKGNKQQTQTSTESEEEIRIRQLIENN